MLKTNLTPSRLIYSISEVNDHARQAELGNAVGQHTGGTVQRFENGHIVTELGKFSRGRKSGRTGTDDSDLVPVDGGISGVGIADARAASRQRIAQDCRLRSDRDACPRYSGLALFFLRTDSAANRRQGIGLTQA